MKNASNISSQTLKSIYLLIRQVFPTARSPTTITLDILNLVKNGERGEHPLKPMSTFSLKRWCNEQQSPYGRGALLLTGRPHFLGELILGVQSSVFTVTLDKDKQPFSMGLQTPCSMHACIM